MQRNKNIALIMIFTIFINFTLFTPQTSAAQSKKPARITDDPSSEASSTFQSKASNKQFCNKQTPLIDLSGENIKINDVSLPLSDTAILGVAGNVAGTTAFKTASLILPREILKRSSTLAASSLVKLIGYSIPGVGPVLGEFAGEITGQVCESFSSNVGKEYKQSQRIDFQKAASSIDWQMCLGKAACGTAGAVTFSIAFPFLGPIAPIAGSIIGSTLGGIAITEIRKRLGNNSSENAQAVSSSASLAPVATDSEASAVQVYSSSSEIEFGGQNQTGSEREIIQKYRNYVDSIKNK